ncbi:hypothetical protein [uncultured Methanoregula sp.]|uniref:hypothetical protein n=1 Tax=uncultured Methanoregula sp. TaxID=1005933 RepID=UPI002AAB460A|nr:hypothetical protein [uncultured Methanoregula sp.]
MGKKNKTDPESTGSKGKKGKPSFEFLNVRFDKIERDTVIRHIVLLIAASLLTKLVLVFVTTFIFQSFIDLFDIGFYFDHAKLLLQGQLPYVNYSFDYPVLVFVPITIAFVPALLLQNAMVFVYSFQILMVLADIVTILCIYFIALRLWDEKRAFFAGLIYATAFSTAYFVLTKYDAFPTAFLMAAILFTVYGMNIKGYLSATLGFFAKIFPAIAFPFMILYNAKDTSIKEEIVSVLKIVVPISIVLFLPILLIRPDVINTYLFATGSSVGIYANTATNTICFWLQDIGHIGIPGSTVSLFMYILMGLFLLLLVFVAYIDTKKNPVTLLKILLCAIFCLVFFTKFHSPQYIVWFTPFLCLLVVDSPYKIILFYLTQVFAYIEFPLMFGRYYTNLEYASTVGSSDWYLTLFFFTAEYVALLVLIFLTVRPDTGIMKRIRTLNIGK